MGVGTIIWRSSATEGSILQGAGGSQNTVLLLVGPLADRPVAGTLHNLYLTTDAGEVLLFHDDGTAWETLIHLALTLEQNGTRIDVKDRLTDTTWLQLDTATGFIHAARFINGLLA